MLNLFTVAVVQIFTRVARGVSIFPNTETLELNYLPSVWGSCKLLMAQARKFLGKLFRLRRDALGVQNDSKN